MKNSAPAWESRVWQSTSSDEKHKTLSKVDKSIFLWSYLYTNRSDWMAACINHMYCIGITLSTSPQKVFCHGLGNLKLYPSGKVGPRKVFNNPRKLFERYRWMEKKFWIVWRDSPYYQVNYNNGSSQFSSLFRSDDDICLHLCRQPIAVSDISIYICLIDFRSKSEEQLNERRAGLSTFVPTTHELWNHFFWALF